MAEWFGEIGPVAAVRIATDYETGRPKGFGHVEFENAADAKKAMDFSGEELEGRALRIDISQPRARARRSCFCACRTCLFAAMRNTYANILTCAPQP